MNIGVLKETSLCERRVGLIPASVRRLVEDGHRVWVERGAGDRSHFPDRSYEAAGGGIAFSAAEVIDRCELLVKIERPAREELELLHPHQTVLAFFHMVVAGQEEVQRVLDKSVTTIGYEIIETPDGRLPVLEPISEIAGQMAVAVAGHLLRSTSGGKGILLVGAPGIAPARVVILGAGVVGSWAARTALNSGALTFVLDNDVSKLRRLLAVAPGAITGLADTDTVREAVRRADVLIGAVLLHGERTPHLVTRAMVETMQAGSVVVDVSIDQGGCVETSRPTSLADPVFLHNGVLHYCVPNMTADIAHTASAALSQTSLPYILELAGRGVEQALEHCPDLVHAVYTFAGECTHQPLAERWHLRSRDIHSLVGQTADTFNL
ncbi:MAG: alanine dehydrogenase [Acidobacteria bacterium]|nr:alanine dehydrogenase [Acidobacteriota bacterium]